MDKNIVYIQYMLLLLTIIKTNNIVSNNFANEVVNELGAKGNKKDFTINIVFYCM